MREIKFRAWDKKRKRMYPVLHLHTETIMNGGIWADVQGYNCIEDKDIVLRIQPKDIEVMQFTGLHDRNGKEIYEGDIVDSYNNECSEIVCKLGCYYIVNPDFSPKPVNALGSPSIVVVVGNIYENPELLKEETK